MSLQICRLTPDFEFGFVVRAVQDTLLVFPHTPHPHYADGCRVPARARLKLCLSFVARTVTDEVVVCAKKQMRDTLAGINHSDNNSQPKDLSEMVLGALPTPVEHKHTGSRKRFTSPSCHPSSCEQGRACDAASVDKAIDIIF